MICPVCKSEFSASASRANRAASIGAPLYCGKTCASLARRSDKTKQQKAEAKRLYDKDRREKLKEALKQKKAEYHKRTYHPDKAREQRKKRMPWHVEYCRRAEYRAKKSEYDHEKRASEYGVFADAYKILLVIEREMRKQQSGYERRKAKGYYQRSSIKRRRELCQAMKALRN